MADFFQQVGDGFGELIEIGGDFLEGAAGRAKGYGEQAQANAAATQAAIDIALVKAQNAEVRKEQYLQILKYTVFGVLIIVGLFVLAKTRK